jgi:hypothetical protein
VQVHHGEGVATHIGPEPCVVIREDAGEASVGERIGQPWSRENLSNSGADVFRFTEGNMDGHVIASAAQPGVVEDPDMCGSSLFGSREISGLARCWTPRVRIGKARSRNR